MRISLVAVLFVLIIAGCKRQSISDANEALIGEWILVKVTYGQAGEDTSPSLRKTRWKFEAGGTLKTYRDDEFKHILTWERGLKAFSGRLDTITHTFDTVWVDALSIDGEAFMPMRVDDDELFFGNGYVDGIDRYFERIIE